MPAPSEYADRLRLSESSRLDPGTRATLGQFMTPATIARDMAERIPEMPETVRLLDPSAGMGALVAAFVEETLARDRKPSSITVTCYEIDGRLADILEDTLRLCEHECQRAGISFAAQVAREDFILDTAARGVTPRFDFAILNPPYRKLHSESRHRLALRKMGIETVNLYAAFSAVALDLLRTGGTLVAITPRSFCNGPYYEPFRKRLLERSALRTLFLFEARDEAFSDDGVLQENVVFSVEKLGEQREVEISSDCETVRAVPFAEIVRPDDPRSFIRIPSGDGTRLSARCHTLDDLGIMVSTGKVVDFRSKPFLRKDAEKGTVPLLYPAHLSDGGVNWPIAEFRKYNALADVAETERLTVPEGTYVLVKRFSAKEERRRLVASVYSGPRSAFENHLNYFHDRGNGLNPDLARGLAAWLNSEEADAAFREFSGHTQVNASDLRNMKYPSREELTAMGRRQP